MAEACSASLSGRILTMQLFPEIALTAQSLALLLLRLSKAPDLPPLSGSVTYLCTSN
jgi:hypothetical protein